MLRVPKVVAGKKECTAGWKIDLENGITWIASKTSKFQQNWEDHCKFRGLIYKIIYLQRKDKIKTVKYFTKKTTELDHSFEVLNINVI